MQTECLMRGRSKAWSQDKGSPRLGPRRQQTVSALAGSERIREKHISKQSEKHDSLKKTDVSKEIFNDGLKGREEVGGSYNAKEEK